MANLNTLVIGFAAALGGLLGGTQGALLALVIVLSISIVVTFAVQLITYNKAKAALEKMQADAESVQWAGAPPTETG